MNTFNISFLPSTTVETVSEETAIQFAEKQLQEIKDGQKLDSIILHDSMKKEVMEFEDNLIKETEVAQANEGVLTYNPFAALL